MSRFATPTTAAPTRRPIPEPVIGYLPAKTRAPRTFAPAADDPLTALEVAIDGKIADMKPSTLNGHGKPSGGTAVFGSRRAPARRASFRTPPR